MEHPVRRVLEQTVAGVLQLGKFCEGEIGACTAHSRLGYRELREVDLECHMSSTAIVVPLY